MDPVPEHNLTSEEMDILQEVMNIAFGSAAADLAGTIDIYVVLSVPTIRLIKAVDLPKYVRNEIKDYEKISIVEQNFMAKFKGMALLIFPSGVGKSLVSLLGNESELESTFESDPLGALERETLMEVGNILVGACVSKIAELLGDVVIYSPPRIVVENLPNESVTEEMFNHGKLAILLQTVFHFNEQNVSGLLFLVCSQESVDWVRKALNEFMKQFE